MKPGLTLCCVASLLICVTARAQGDDSEQSGDERTDTETERQESDAPTAPATEGLPAARREVPDYDGRPPPGPPPEEAALFVPRALLAPLHFVFEYLVRRPLAWLFTTAEREHWDFIQLIPFAQVSPSWGIAPTALFDFGLTPSVGALLWANDVVLPHNQLLVHAAFGGDDFLRGTVADRQLLNTQTAIEVNAQAWQRPDQFFLGLGPIAQSAYTARYGQRRVGVDVGVRVQPWRASHFLVSMGAAGNELYDTDYLASGQRTMTDAVAHGWFPGVNGLPAGWPGYSVYRQRVEGSIDSRQLEPDATGGVRVEAHLEHAFDLADPLDRRWLLWGGGIGAFIDIDRGRTIGLFTMASLASRLGSRDIPFTELPDLGANLRMPGFLPGWIRGESAVLSVLEYRYPIGVSLGGFVTASVGNAFRSMFDGFTPGLLRMGFGIGIRSLGDPGQAFTLTLGIGTETFDEGLGVTTFRIVAGTLRGF